jgi:hypothetical protein
VGQLVYEKENRLRMMMKMHGLEDSAYWIVQYSWFLLLYVVYAAAFLVFGHITQLAFFTRNDPGGYWSPQHSSPTLAIMLVGVF